MMRFLGFIACGALVLAAALPARAQVYVSSVTAAVPDGAGKVPGFNLVTGSAIPNWANGLAQVVLTHGQAYNYCVSFGTAAVVGRAGVTFKISRGGVAIQTGTIIAPGGLMIGSNGIWYLCSGYTVLPTSPGEATLSGTVAYTPTGGQRVAVTLNTKVLLQ